MDAVGDRIGEIGYLLLLSADRFDIDVGTMKKFLCVLLYGDSGDVGEWTFVMFSRFPFGLLLLKSVVSFRLMRQTSRCRSIELARVRGGTRFEGDVRPGYIVTGCSLTIDSVI